MFPSGLDDPDTLSDEKESSTTSPSTRDEDMDVDGSEGDSNGDDVDIGEPLIQSVVGPDGFRKFIMLPLWTINDFNSSIKQTHFNMLREKYQIPINIPMCLPFKCEKCYYRGVKDVEVYEQHLKVGLRFSLNALHCCLLQYLGLAVTQISPNTWKVFLGVEVLYRVMSNGAHGIMVEEFFHCYHPSEITQSKGMYSFVPRSLLLRPVCNTLDSNKNWKSCYFFIQRDNWICHPDDEEYILVDKT